MVDEKGPSAKQEKFLRAVAAGMAANKAYHNAYECAWSTANTNAYILLKRPDLKRWLNRYRAQAGVRMDVTVDEVIRKIRLAVDGALEDRKWGEAINGSHKLGTYIGMDKSTLDDLGTENPFALNHGPKAAKNIGKIAGSVTDELIDIDESTKTAGEA